MERYDVAIIGSGPAGLSAAITAKIRNKNIIVFGNDNLSDKILKAQEIKNYPGLGVVSGEQLRDGLKKHIEQLGICITNEKISAIYNMGNYFGIQGSPDIFEASTVILATGVIAQKSIPGEDTFLGRGVSYCATCDGMLYKGKVIAVVGYSKQAESEVQFLAEIADKLLYFPMYKGEVSLDENVVIVREAPTEITGGLKADCIKTNESEYKANGIFVLRDSISPSQLISGIEMEKNHIVTDKKMATNIEGCFACGDVTGPPYQYIKSAGEGNVAALSCVEYLAKQKQ